MFQRTPFFLHPILHLKLPKCLQNLDDFLSFIQFIYGKWKIIVLLTIDSPKDTTESVLRKYNFAAIEEEKENGK
jgi:hypothetical protein